MAYSWPLTVVSVKVTGLPARLIAVSVRPPGPLVGTMPVSEVAPTPTPTENVRVSVFQASPENDDALRPSSQVSSWRAAITGTPRDWADARVWLSSNVVSLVGVQVGGERPVVAQRAQRAVEQGVGSERDSSAPTRRSSRCWPGRRRSSTRRCR